MLKVFSNLGKVFLVDDSAFQYQNGLKRIKLTNCDFKKSIVISPFHRECEVNTELFKLRLYAEKNNLKVISFGSPNFFPLYSLFSDEVVLCDSYQPMFYQGDTHNGICLNKVSDKFWDIDHNNKLRKMVDKSISNDEVVDRFWNWEIYIRESTYQAFQKLELEENLLVAEIKATCNKIRSVLHSLNIKGADHLLQKKMISRVGTNNYLGCQILASQLKNWTYIVAGGACNLFSILPIKVLYHAERRLRPNSRDIIRKISMKRYGDYGDTIPILIQKNLCKGQVEKEKYIKNNILENLEFIQDSQEHFNKLDFKPCFGTY
jgi:hypothetical protein